MFTIVTLHVYTFNFIRSKVARITFVIQLLFAHAWRDNFTLCHGLCKKPLQPALFPEWPSININRGSSDRKNEKRRHSKRIILANAYYKLQCAWKPRKSCRGGSKRCRLPDIINNGNRTEWSPIRYVIIRLINKIGRSRSGSPICLITSIITDRIGRHEVLFSINHNYNKIW